ncbi:ABC transporter ATP-binding protein [Campylobacter sp. RM9328]|uniref:energy-coupling factor ABC transporter ATP-binding protein n=1 Tax=Campylobacter sp. RM9328 TaxID=1705720 RepID=UPI00147357A1|nr:ABC transporter ATP-binding protein [Campylobacter sp. RM9328]
MSCSVTIRNLSVSANENLLFSGVNLNVSHKEKIAIIGANGSGKTTLLETIAGLRNASGGVIELFHEPMLNLDSFKKYRGEIGYLFQDSDDQFIYPKVLEDVAFSLLSRGVDKDEAVKKTREILEHFGIWHLKDKIVFHLSGGEKKLVALAGVLIFKPKILLLDEPTTALDFKMQTRLTQILKSLDISQIIVSHDKEFVRNVADKIYYLNENGLSEDRAGIL